MNSSLNELTEASRTNNIAEVYKLIENGANINSQNSAGHTALFVASNLNRREIAYILIQAGADINIQTSYGGYTPLMIAAENNNIEILDMLIQAGAELNHREITYVSRRSRQGSNNGDTALLSAVKNNYIEIVKSLVSAGADLNIQVQRVENGEEGVNIGDTALMIAVKNNYTEIVKSLVRGGADIYIENSEGLNAIDMMDENTNRTIRQLLSSRVARETLNRHEVEGLRNFYPPHPIPSLQKIAYDAVIKAKKRDMSNLTHEERIDINRINSNLYPHSKPHLTKYVRKNRNRSHSPYRRIRMEQKRLSEPRNITQKHRSSPRRRSRGRSISSSSSTLRGSSRGRSRGSSTSSSTSSSRGRSRGRSRERR
jgi:ankyrin repeat protein